MVKRAYHSTLVLKESLDTLKVYLIGGKYSEYGIHKNMNVITITTSNKELFWILHYLESTGIQKLIGLNMIQEIIEMVE